MSIHTPEEINTALTKIPDELREAVFAPETNEKVLAIGRRYGLNIEQSDILMTNVRLVMIGILSPEDFKRELAANLNLPTEAVEKITTDVSIEIVQDALASLRKHQETKHFTDEEIEAMLAEEDEETISAEEGQNLATSGIEVINQPIAPISTPTETLSRESLLEDVQNPTRIAKTIPAVGAADEIQRGITGEKLAGNFKIPGEQKDYSVNKSAEPAPTSIKVIRHKDRVDPYRETVE